MKTSLATSRNESKILLSPGAANVFYGGFRTFEQRWEFWQTAAFANFVQDNIQVSRKRPEKDEWQRGANCFQEYLEELRPEFILALGKKLWTKLPFDESWREYVPVEVNGQSMPCRLYRHKGGYSFAFGIDHPAYPGWSYGKWGRWVRAALESAIAFHTGTTVIRHKNRNILGTIRRLPSGRLQARSSNGRIVGTYDVLKNRTVDSSGHILAKGDVLSGLVLASGVTSKPTIEGHFKTDHRAPPGTRIVLPRRLPFWQPKF